METEIVNYVTLTNYRQMSGCQVYLKLCQFIYLNDTTLSYISSNRTYRKQHENI